MTLARAILTNPAIPGVRAALEYLHIENPRWGDCKQVAHKHGVSPSMICDRLRRWGVAPRMRKGRAA